MKEQQKNKIDLKKLTIAKINLDSMRNVNGGSSVPTSGNPDYFYCILDH